MSGSAIWENAKQRFGRWKVEIGLAFVVAVAANGVPPKWRWIAYVLLLTLAIEAVIEARLRKVLWAVAIAVLLGGVALSVSSGPKPPPPVSGLCQIYVRSDVTPATVYLDGEPCGKLTRGNPDTTLDVGVGRHTVTVQGDGFRQQKALTLHAGEKPHTFIVLEK